MKTIEQDTGNGRNRRTSAVAAVLPRRGAVLVFTLVMIFMTSVAIFLFIEKATYEIRSEAVHLERDRLRPHAYSVLEAVMAVLHDIKEIDGTLYDSPQGWENPLEYADVRLPGEVRATVSFLDETGKLPLPQMDRERLILLFEELEYDQSNIDDLADALLSWVDETHDQSHVGGGFFGYDQGDLPYRASHQPLKSLYELAAVEGFRELFFDAAGTPTGEFYRFAELVSLREFQTVNVNTASSRVLRVWGEYGETEQLVSMDEFRQNSFRNEHNYFEDLGDANIQLGTDLPGNRFGTSIRYLRVIIRVSEGNSEHRLNALLDIDRPADVDRTNQQPQRRGRPDPETAAEEGGAAGDHVLQNYPFTILELRENASILN